MANIAKNIGVFLLFVGSGIALYPVFGYFYGLLESIFNFLSILGPSCTVYNTTIGLLYGIIPFLLGTFVYYRRLK